MGKHLIVLGHGEGPGGAYDPGASGNGTNEDQFLNNEFLPHLQKYAPDNVEFYTKKNMYAHRDAQNVSGYDSVTELHLDWAQGASGGHVIIYGQYEPDEVDKEIRDVVEKYVGLRMYGGISKRDDLLNLNTFAKRGITYRLVELGFINNADDMQKIRNNMDAYARDLVSAITGGEIKEVDEPQTDYEGHSHEEAIELTKALGILQGYSATEFRPDEPLTNARFAAAVKNMVDEGYIRIKR